MTVQVLDEADVRRIAREEARRPEFTNQRNVEQHVGVPGRQYLRDARARRFPAVKERRLIIARTADVVAYYELRIATSKASPSNDSDPEGIAFARVGARRVGQ